MKTSLKLVLLLAVVGFATACSNSGGETVTAEEATKEAAEATATAQTYTIDNATSVINWAGDKTFVPDGGHVGTVRLQSGQLAVEGNNLVAGSFVIDMSSIANTDVEDEKYRNDFNGHLMSDDFFSVETHPTARFEVTSVATVEGNPNLTHNITGNLTLRDSTKQITFPANVAIASGQITAVAPEFKIDRTDWGVMYSSDKLNLADLAKDRVISNDIRLNIVLNAKTAE